MINIPEKKRGRPKGSKNKNGYKTTILPRQRALADLYSTGKYSLAKVYEMAGYKCEGWDSTNKSMKAKAVLNLPVVKEYLATIHKETQEQTMITREFILNQYMDVIMCNEPVERQGAASKLKALEQASKMLGYDKPSEEVEEHDTIPWVIPASQIGKAFVDINRAIDSNVYKEYWFEGGRGSIKSSYCSLKIIELLESNPTMCVIAMRAVGNTINDSIYSQLVWAIEQAGLIDEYKCIKNPHGITKKSTGQKIYFRGLDDAAKIKSIRPPSGMYIGIQWFEEFDQIRGGMSEVRKIEQSILRGGNTFYRFKSYNTPPSMMHFVNKEKIVPKKGRIVHTSNYLEAPVEWLGEAFLDEANYLKEVNEQAYLNEYMGVVTGVGGMVFQNLEIREITEEEFNGFNDPCQGLDFGWFPDPLHFSQCYYNPAQRILYITDEFRANKMNNRQLYDTLIEKGLMSDNIQIIADSAEPKSIQDLHDYGAFIKAAEKGAGSVRYSIKWLANLAKIVIDPIRCPETAKEFSEYELERDRDGNYTSNFPDVNNHAIDSVRYATNKIWRVRGQ